MKRFGALFDLDGVLIDSEHRYTEFWDAIERIYPTGIPDYACAIKGTTLETILENYPSAQVRDDIVSRLRKFQREMPFELFPGVDRLLNSLASAGIPMVIVTSSDSNKMARLRKELPEFIDRFAYVIDGSMVTHSKPDPEGYRKGASLLSMDPADCCVFEDSLQGLRAGRAAGGKVVGLCTTYDRESVEPLADLTVGTLADVTVADIAALWA